MVEIISIDEFLKSDVRVVKVVQAEPIPGKSRILKLVIEIEPEKTQTIVAGGAQYYTPDHFIGKKFVALLNLAPRQIGGVDSQGMLLAAEVGGKPVWLTVEEDAPPGSRVR